MMDDYVIRVENLGKRYRIGAMQSSYRTLRDGLANTLAARLRRLRRAESSADRSDILWALREVSFEVRAGDVVGVIGRNGAGKSTLLKILAHITRPSTGTVRLRGRIGSLLEVGTGFHPELTGRENIYLNGAILGMKRVEIERKFDEIVAFAEIEKFLDTPVKHYSSGMHVRLAFAVAAHLEPEILLVDEVLAVGDVAFQKKCLGKMGEVAQGGRTVLLVSHNMASIRSLCSQSILLEHGRVEMVGPTENVIMRYLLSSSAEMISSVPLPPGAPDLPARATRLWFTAQDGTLQTEFRLGQPWRMHLSFEVRRPLSHVIAGIGIMTVEAVPVITYWSDPQDLQPGTYQVSVDCNVPLASCSLQFNIGLSSQGRTFYYVENVGLVSVSEVALGAQPVRASGTGLLSNLEPFRIQPA